MNKIYQPFIIEKSDQILEVLKNDIKPSEYIKNRLCDILTNKFIQGELSSDDPINSIFEEEELMKFINECLIYEDLHHLKELKLIDSFNDENNEELYFLTKEGKKYMENIMKIKK